jgi:hypothetical protein
LFTILQEANRLWGFDQTAAEIPDPSSASTAEVKLQTLTGKQAAVLKKYVGPAVYRKTGAGAGYTATKISDFVRTSRDWLQLQAHKVMTPDQRFFLRSSNTLIF